ncbi:gamma-mobile-trio protein GmtX [Metapseudomonas otitidis]
MTRPPDSLYKRLIDNAKDSRRKRSLHAIHESCRLLNERKSKDFSYRAIVHLGRDRGLNPPSEKSILNPTGEHYRILISAWRRVSVGEKQNASSKQEVWITKIKEPALRMAVSIMAEELRSFKAKEARKSNLLNAPIIIGELSGRLISPQLRLNDAEISALKSSINPPLLNILGLSIGTRGEITDSSGRVVFKPGFQTAIEKILSLI